MSSVPDAFPVLGNDLFLSIACALELRDTATALRVCKAWREVLDGNELVWRLQCMKAWKGKAYVPHALRVMAKGAAAVTQSELDAHKELMSQAVRELKRMALKVNTPMGHLIEKADFAESILSARRQQAEEGSETLKILERPMLLVRQGETLPKAALRLSLHDATRTTITQDELCSFTFNVRLRKDGPLAQAVHLDPWWMGVGCGEAKYHTDGRLTLSWPPDPDSEDGKPMDPFAAMGMTPSNVSLGWELRPLPTNGCIVQIFFNGRPGPQEVVCRHPHTWGWVLHSQGTCWTSWTMPRCVSLHADTGSDEGRRAADLTHVVCDDPLLRDENLHLLPSQVQREF